MLPKSGWPSPASVILVVPTLEENSLGRAYALSLVLDAVEIEWFVVSLRGNRVWSPLRNSEFANRCQKLAAAEMQSFLERARCVIAVKPLPDSLSLCLRHCNPNFTRLIVDIDDPDLELRLEGWHPLQQYARRLLRPRRHKELHALNSAVKKLSVIVSNPELQKKYGGVVIPHVRETGAHETSRQNLSDQYIIFLGSPRRHKGLRVIEESVREVNNLGYRLGFLITAKPRVFGRKWEKRVGNVSFKLGRQLLLNALGTVVLITREPYASLQLPAKAIDAITAGVPLIFSATKPLLWATSGKGIPLKESSKAEVTNALIALLSRDSSFHSNREPSKSVSFAPESYGATLAQLIRGQKMESPTSDFTA